MCSNAFSNATALAPKGCRAERGLDVHEKRVADQSRKDAHAVLLDGFANDEARLTSVRRDNITFLNRRPFRHVTKGDVNRMFRRARSEGAARSPITAGPLKCSDLRILNISAQ